MFKFSIASKKILGIDIGTDSIKILEASAKGKTSILENYGEIRTAHITETPFKMDEKSSMNLADKNIASAILEIKEEAGIKTNEACFSIPDFCSFFTTLEIPQMDEEEIPQAVQYEVRPYIPMPLSEIYLDWIITEGQMGKTKIKMLIAAIPNWVVDQYKEIAKNSNLRARFLEPEAFALARSVSQSHKENILGVIDMGARSATCGVIERGILKNSYSFNLAGNELTERLSRSLNIDYAKAEELKKQYGLMTDGPKKEEIKKVLRPLMDSVMEELKKVLRNFYRDEGKEVEKIVLSGGMALMPGIKNYFKEEFQKEAVIARPFDSFSYPPQLKETLEKKGPSYAVCAGLALKGLE